MKPILVLVSLFHCLELNGVAAQVLCKYWPLLNVLSFRLSRGRQIRSNQSSLGNYEYRFVFVRMEIDAFVGQFVFPRPSTRIQNLKNLTIIVDEGKRAVECFPLAQKMSFGGGGFIYCCRVLASLLCDQPRLVSEGIPEGVEWHPEYWG